MRSRIAICLGGLATLCLTLAPVATAQDADIPRTPSGRPDLSGTYDVSTLTPMERPAELGEKMALTDEEAAELAERTRQAMAFANRRSDPNRGAPPQGGDGSTGASGNVGGYNAFWIDPGESAFQVDGQWRTYCHEMCKWTDETAFRPTYQGRQTPNMGKLIGHREWETLY
ncbi:MAG: hypothetical protein QF681_11725, partial [Vicinamibacterales bacterium]|nr:hypothetical protein [Vicinamibacterales bacterium]